MDLAQHAGLDDLGEGGDVAAAAMVEGHLEDAAGAAGGLDHRAGGLGGLRHRLLGEDVHAGLEGGDRHGRVEEGGRRDGDDVEIGLLEHLLPVRVAQLDAVLVAEAGEQVVLHRGEGDEVHGGVGGVGGDVLLAGPAQADHAGAESSRGRGGGDGGGHREGPFVGGGARQP